MNPLFNYHTQGIIKIKRSKIMKRTPVDKGVLMLYILDEYVYNEYVIT